MKGSPTRTIFHVDVDAFFAAVEQRDDPALRGRPVVVGGSSARGVVAAASYEARVFGIHSAMPSAEARKRCPEAVFVRGNMRKYRAESRRIFEIFRRYSPVVEGLSVDEAFLDMTGTARLLGTPRDVAERLRAEVRAVTALTVSVGIAPIKMVAKIASAACKPDGCLLVPADGIEDFLAPLPVGRIWGVGRVARQRLAALGLETIGDLARRPDAELQATLGTWGVGLACLARGDDAREVEPYREAKSYGEENTFEHDMRPGEPLDGAIRQHAEAVGRRLRRDRVRGGGVTLKVKLARRLGGGRFRTLTRSLMLGAPTDDGRAIAAAAGRLLARADLQEPIRRDAIRLIGVAVTHLSPVDADPQLALGLTGDEGLRRARLNTAIDTIQERFGDGALRRGATTVGRAGLSLQVKRGDRDRGA